MLVKGLIQRERTPLPFILYALYLYYSGLSLRCVSKALEHVMKRSHNAIWLWIQRFSQLTEYFQVGRVDRIAIDESWFQVGGQEAWLWIAIEPHRRKVLGVYVSRHRNILVAELILSKLKAKYGEKPVYSDGASWYPDACRSLGLRHEVYGDDLKAYVERIIQSFKDRIESFDDYFPCRKLRCPLNHVKAWMSLYAFYYNFIWRHETPLETSVKPTKATEYETLTDLIEEKLKTLT
jgi:putative transposase